MPASRPPQSQWRRMISLVSTSSGFCTSPWTLVVSSEPTWPSSAPFAATALIALIAAATSTSSAASAWPSGELLSCSIRNFDSVVRRVNMVLSPANASVLVCHGVFPLLFLSAFERACLFAALPGAVAIDAAAKHAAGANVLGGEQRQLLLGRRRVVRGVGEQAIGLAQARAVERVADRAGVGEVRLLHAQRDVLAQRLQAVGVEAVVHLR